MEICFGLTSGYKHFTSWINFAVFLSMMWGCAEGWSYYYSNSTMNWQQARVWCQTYYTDMVAIQNQEEIMHLNNWLPRKDKYYWIGIRKINNVWTWVGTNKPLTVEATNWAEGEPNNGKNRLLSKSSEDCVEMYIKRDQQPGKWNDERCQKRKTALCYTAACQSDSCLHGECIETINSHRCECFEGFYGEKCDQVVKCDEDVITVPNKGKVNCIHKYGNYSYDTLCEYSCENGYKLSMNNPLRCTATRNWSESPPTCEPVQCKELSTPERGSMKCSDPLGSSSYQSSCEFTCNEGYQIAGLLSNTLQCEASGDWNASEPFCAAVRCPILEAPANGNISCSNDEQVYNTQCSFMCNQDHVLEGRELLSCDRHGNWTGEKPICQAPAKANVIASSLAVAGCMSLSTVSLAIWILRRLRQRASKFELNSNSNIEAPLQVYKNSFDGSI